jgi:hypothetical protein
VVSHLAGSGGEPRDQPIAMRHRTPAPGARAIGSGGATGTEGGAKPSGERSRQERRTGERRTATTPRVQIACKYAPLTRYLRSIYGLVVLGSPTTTGGSATFERPVSYPLKRLTGFSDPGKIRLHPLRQCRVER